METDSLASRNNFLPFSQIGVNCLQANAFFPLNGSYFSANPLFRLVETCFLFVGNIFF